MIVLLVLLGAVIGYALCDTVVTARRGGDWREPLCAALLIVPLFVWVARLPGV